MQRALRSTTPAVEKLQVIMGFLPKARAKENMAALSLIYPNYL